MSTSIAMIGAGHMGLAMLNGFLKKGSADSPILVSSPNAKKLAELQAQYGVMVTTDNAKAIAAADIVFLCVKPNIVATVARQLADVDLSGKCLVSIAAGVSMAQLRRYFGPQIELVRAMPNMGAQCGLSATGLVPYQLSQQNRAKVSDFLQAIGEVYWLETEAQLDALTAVSGSGPAYFFYLLEAMQDGADALGLSRDLTTNLLLQTMQAAHELARRQPEKLNELRRQVTSPGGTTAAAVTVFEKNTLSQTIRDAMRAAYDRARQLAKGE